MAVSDQLIKDGVIYFGHYHYLRQFIQEAIKNLRDPSQYGNTPELIAQRLEFALKQVATEDSR